MAERRRWQSAMTSPIGDVGSKRVNIAVMSQHKMNIQDIIFLIMYIVI